MIRRIPSHANPLAHGIAVKAGFLKNAMEWDEMKGICAQRESYG